MRNRKVSLLLLLTHQKDVNFIGYTFKRDVEQRSHLVSALEDLEKFKHSKSRKRKPEKPVQEKQKQPKSYKYDLFQTKEPKKNYKQASHLR